MKPFSLYVHIPYCHQKCPYCDFNTYAVTDAPETEYTQALLAELDFRASQEDWSGRSVQTIYFGGGTPSIFSPRSIKKIISMTLQRFPVTDDIEVSLEANPGMVSDDYFVSIRDAGINRISFGAQSFNPPTLKALGRIHTPEQTRNAVVAARDAGISNISIDLIYGAPEQTLADIRSDLTIITYLGIAHVSAYCLTVEKGTPFYQAKKRGLLKIPADELVLEEMRVITEELRKAGLLRYEISNYSIPLKEARHNLAYWEGDDYLGLGAGAHSYVSYLDDSDSSQYGRRWSNYALPQKYIESATTIGLAESWSEHLDLPASVFEFFFLGLRKTAGVSLELFKTRFGFSALEYYEELFDILTAEGFMEKTTSGVKLTQKGIELSDSVLENFAKVTPSSIKIDALKKGPRPI